MGGARGRLVSPQERAEAINLINNAVAQGARKRIACELLGIAIRTIERWEKEGVIDQRKGAKRHIVNKLTEEERTLVLTTANSPEYCDLSPGQIVPSLADKSIYIASESSFYRILRKEKQLTHRGRTKPRTHKKSHTHKATGANQLWSWDITYLPSQVRGMYFYLYLIMDVYSRKIVGWSIHDEQNAAHAANLIQQSCIDEGIRKNILVLHSDNGGPMKGSSMLAMLEKLGVTASFSRPSVSDDNPFSESLFKTLKYHRLFPVERFETLFDARAWTIKFAAWYNDIHMHSGLKFITPNQRHLGADRAIMEKRHDVYQKAKERNPHRWSGSTRNWELPAFVTLNANKKNKVLVASEENKRMLAA